MIGVLFGNFCSSCFIKISVSFYVKITFFPDFFDNLTLVVLFLFEAGLQVDDRHIWRFHSNHEMWIQNKYSVEYSLDDLMKCTALVCYNDMLEEEIYHDLSQKGIRVPQDLSIVEFDNQNIKLDGDCYLTSVQHPRRKLGEIAANLVCDMIEQGCGVAPAEPIIMPSTIVARNSIIRFNDYNKKYFHY